MFYRDTSCLGVLLFLRWRAALIGFSVAVRIAIVVILWRKWRTKFIISLVLLWSPFADRVRRDATYKLAINRLSKTKRDTEFFSVRITVH